MEGLLKMKSECNDEQLKVIATYAKNMICPYNINAGDIADKGLKDFYSYSYRMKSDNYRGSSSSSCEDMLNAVSNALLRVESTKEPLLLLSDGKDSMSLAIAYSNIGVSVKTLTFLRREDKELEAYISDVAKELGHQPYFVNVDDIINNYDEDVFLSACSHMPNPVLDQGFLFFLFGLRKFFSDNELNANNFNIIDGLGNDETLGYLPSKNQLTSFTISKLNLWKLVPNALSGLRWFIRSPSESNGDLSALSCFFSLSSAYDLNKYFSKIKLDNKPLSYLDFRAFSRGSFHDHQCMMGKTITAARYLGSDVTFPWVDKDLASYSFNLPLESKFDFEKLENKSILRTLLSRKLSWEQSKRGIDLYFDLNEEKFISLIAAKTIPNNVIRKISKNKTLPAYVKKRAFLELLNFYGYCLSHGYSKEDAEILLE